ncbi:hypothetical protein [Gimesia sp.]|uniref:hypothetical protein n=1 Tax=Gimesia sp. TaxID=2024833 RepID=UPI0032F086F0
MGASDIEDNISDDDYLIRRISPSKPGWDTIAKNKDGTFRASSSSMSTRPNEEHLSCSLLKVTKPQDLLDQLKDQGIEPDGWNVALFKVGDARALGLEISLDKTDSDEGHCLLKAEGGLDYPKIAGKKIAKKTRILNADEIADPESIE